MDSIKTIDTVSKFLNIGTVKIILFGANRNKDWEVEAHENSVYYLNKDRHLILRQVEFILRAFFTGVLIHTMNQLFIVNWVSNLFMHFNRNVEAQPVDTVVQWAMMVVLFAECAFTCLFYYYDFKGGLINVHAQSKRVKRIGCSILVVNICTFVLYSLWLWNISLSICSISLAVYLYGIVAYCCWQLRAMKLKTIYKFETGSRCSRPDPKYVLLEQDISINLHKGNEKRPIDLLKSNLYICDTDDILLTAVGRPPVLFYKEEVKSLQIKDVEVMYDNNEHKWRKK